MFSTPKLQKIIRDMKFTLAKEDDGVALAAPQIGVSLRIFVVSDRIMEILHSEKINKNQKYTNVVFINPEIIKVSREKEILEEGCLSVRFLYGKIERAKKVKIRAMNENGDMFEMGASGLLAQIFQHEIDHLTGKLFLDNATDIQEILPSDIANHSNKQKMLRNDKKT